MNDLLQPLIHKAALRDIAINIARAGLSINDSAFLKLLPNEQIAVCMEISRPILGLIPRRKMVTVGLLSPSVTEMLLEPVRAGESLRVRVVGLTPEHLTLPGAGPEVHVSIWGDPRRLTLWGAKDKDRVLLTQPVGVPLTPAAPLAPQDPDPLPPQSA